MPLISSPALTSPASDRQIIRLIRHADLARRAVRVASLAQERFAGLSKSPAASKDILEPVINRWIARQSALRQAIRSRGLHAVSYGGRLYLGLIAEEIDRRDGRPLRCIIIKDE